MPGDMQVAACQARRVSAAFVTCLLRSAVIAWSAGPADSAGARNALWFTLDLRCGLFSLGSWNLLFPWMFLKPSLNRDPGDGSWFAQL